MNYAIIYVDARGEKARKTVDASSLEEALSRLNIAEANFISAKESSANSWLSNLLDPAPKLQTQALFLSSLSSIAYVGGNVMKMTRSLIKKYKIRVRNPALLDECHTVSDTLRILRFAPHIITFIEVGEKSRRLGEMLEKAADDLNEYQRVQSIYGKSLRTGKAYLFTGLSLLMSVPNFFGPQLLQAINEPGQTVETGFFGDLMLSLFNIYSEYGYFIVAAIAAMFYFKKKILYFLRNIPVLSTAWNLVLQRRGLDFLSTFRPLLQSGVSEERALKIIKSSTHADNIDAYTSLLDKMLQGRNLSDSLDSADWPFQIRIGMSGFETTNKDMRVKIVDNVIGSLKLQYDVFSSRLGRNMLFTGMLILSFAIIMMYLGGILPLTTIHAG